MACSCRSVTARSGAVFDVLTLTGDTRLLAPLVQEAGGHRWQRVPPTEKRGRVQTSTVTVAVISPAATSRNAQGGGSAGEIEARDGVLREGDVEILVTKGTGAGGQNRNKRETAIVMRHRPTGIEAKAESERTQIDNKRRARAVLEERVAAHYAGLAKSQEDGLRRQQVGTGMRGDKVRTYRERDDVVTDHRSGRKARLARVREGRLELVWGNCA